MELVAFLYRPPQPANRTMEVLLVRQGVSVLEAVARTIAGNEIPGDIAAHAFIAQGLYGDKVLWRSSELKRALSFSKTLGDPKGHAVTRKIFNSCKVPLLRELLMCGL